MKISIDKIVLEKMQITIENLKTDIDIDDIKDFIFQITQLKQNALLNVKEEIKKIPISNDRVTKILNEVGPQTILVENLLGELKQVLLSSNGTVPRRALDPYNRLAMFFRLPFLEDLKPKKSLTEPERRNCLKFLNDSFLEWLDFGDIGGNTEVNEEFRTQVVIDAIQNALTPVN